MELVSLVIAVGALLLAIASQHASRPRLRIQIGDWDDPQVGWDFAVIQISNRPFTGPLRVFNRAAAFDCRVDLTYRKGNRAIGPIPGRWSARPEPLRLHPQPSGGVSAVVDPSLFPSSYVLTLPPTGEGQEMAVAVASGGRCSAFSAESYRHSNWQKPEWTLDPGVWEVEAVVTTADGSGASATFQLEITSAGSLAWLDTDRVDLTALRQTFPWIAPGLGALLGASLTLSWALEQDPPSVGFYDSASQAILVLLLALVIEARAFSATHLAHVARAWGPGYVLLHIGLLLLAIVGGLLALYGTSQTPPSDWLFPPVAASLAALLIGIAVAAIVLPQPPRPGSQGHE